MSQSLFIKADLDSLNAFARRIDPTRLRQYASTAVNDTARQIRTRVVVEIVKGSSIARPTVERAVRISDYSNPQTLSATVKGSGRPISLKEFGAVQTATGVTATVWGKAQYYPHAFIVPSLGGHVFKREGSSRLPIKKMWGSGIAQVMTQNEIAQTLVTIGRQRLAINTKRQMQRALYAQGKA